jgi:hypothetical protein
MSKQAEITIGKIQATHKRTARIGDDYIVTDDGTVYRYWYNHKQWQRQSPRKSTKGYMRGVIYGKDKYIHRLVAELFVENPNGYKEVNHKDGNKTNNHADNLEWCTRSENNKHAFQTGLRDYRQLSEMGKKGGKARRAFTDSQVREIRQLRSGGVKIKDIAKRYGAPRQTIQGITSGRTYADVR